MSASPVSARQSPRTIEGSLGAGFFQAGLAVWVTNPYPQGEDASEAYRANRLLDPKRSSRPVFVPGKVIEVLQNGHIRVRTDWEPKIELSCTKDDLYLANVRNDVDDMTDLAHLNDATLLDNVQTRYHRDPHQQIYTMAGTILIAVNPYRVIQDRNGISIYDQSYIEQYKNSPVRLAGGDSKGLPPHIFGVAARAVSTFAQECENQSIVISGESGAGKTESTKQIMQYITCCSSRSAKDSSKEAIESKLLKTNPVLEALGNAKTIRNDNSSRFGKFIQIYMKPKGSSAVQILGGSIQDYLLEKSRVVAHTPGERNYHVFYQLLKGLNSEEKTGLGLSHEEDFFRYLNPQKQNLHSEKLLSDSIGRGRRTGQEIEGTDGRTVLRPIDDEAAFEELQSSLEVVGLGKNHRDNLFRTIAAILHLGNIELETIGTDDAHVVAQGAGHQALDKAAELLCVEASELASALVTKTSVTASQVITSSLDCKRAYEGIDALAKSIYGILFRWVVQQINETLHRQEGHSKNTGSNDDGVPSYIGILDIFGFEVFGRNGFEQFCINFANEKLHQLFTTHVFKLEQKIYQEEGIDYSAITFADNQLIIDLIEKRPRGVLALLDESCLFPQATDESFLSKLDQAHGSSTESSSAFFRKANIRESKTGSAFVVMHSAATVVYTAADFLSKNRDRLESNLVRVISKSKSEWLSGLFKAQFASSEAEQGSFTGSNAFLGSKFKDDINKLMRTLNSTSPHFVRCLKANGEKRQGFMDPDLVLHQLQYLGVLDSIRIRHSGFSFRTSFHTFYARFALVVPSLPSPAALSEQLGGNKTDPTYRMKCKELMDYLWKMATATERAASPTPGDANTHQQVSENDLSAHKLGDMVQLGTTRIFLRKQMIQTLEALRDVKLQAMEASAIKIQALCRMRLARTRIIKIQLGLRRIRAAWAAVQDRRAWVHHVKVQQALRRTALVWKARTILARRRRALALLQAFTRRVLTQRRFQALKRSAHQIQGIVRSFILRKRFRMWTRVVTKIQCVARSFLIRNRIYWRRVRGALLLQASWRGFKTRESMPMAMTYLAEKRHERARHAAARSVQNQWQTYLIRRRYLEMRTAACELQRWSMSFILRDRFKTVQASVRTIQRLGRGFLARNLRRKIITARLLEEDTLELNRLRYREAVAVREGYEHPFCGRPAVFQRRGANATTVVTKTTRKHHVVLDVDMRTNVSKVYSAGWTRACKSLEDTLIVDAGDFHTVALTSHGEVYTWGFGDRGQLGHGNYSARTKPSCISAFARSQIKIKQIQTGSCHTMALSQDGRVYTWGAGSHGQLGLGNMDNQANPCLVSSLSKRKIADIACGSTFSMARTQAGTVYTWGGPGPCLGQGVYVGDGCNAHPMAVHALAREHVEHIQAGRTFAVALTRSGKLFSWGKGDYGQLGLGDDKDRVVPQELGLPSHAPVLLVAVGARHAGAVDSQGNLFMWGSNTHGQLGVGDTDFRSRPTHVAKLKGGVQHLALGWRQSLAYSELGELFVWGVSVLNLDGEGRADARLMDNCSEMLSMSVEPQLVHGLNLCKAGRRLTQLTSSRAPSMSYLGMHYEQRPATLKIYASPILHSTSSIDMHKLGMFLKDEEEGNDNKNTIYVDGKGKRHNMKHMTSEQLQNLVRELVTQGPDAKAFLDEDPKEKARRSGLLKQSKNAQVVHGVRYIEDNALSTVRISRSTSAPKPTPAPALSLEGRDLLQARSRTSSVLLRREHEQQVQKSLEALHAQMLEREQSLHKQRIARLSREGGLNASSMSAQFSSHLLLRRENASQDVPNGQSPEEVLDLSSSTQIDHIVDSSGSQSKDVFASRPRKASAAFIAYQNAYRRASRGKDSQPRTNLERDSNRKSEADSRDSVSSMDLETKSTCSDDMFNFARRGSKDTKAKSTRTLNGRASNGSHSVRTLSNKVITHHKSSTYQHGGSMDSLIERLQAQAEREVNEIWGNMKVQ